jgi:hypothetical protein
MRLSALISQGLTNIRHASRERRQEEARSPFLPCLCDYMEEVHFFENQQTSTFVTFVPRHRMPGRPERDKHSVLINPKNAIAFNEPFTRILLSQ